MCTCSFVRCSVCFQREVRFLSAGTKASKPLPSSSFASMRAANNNDADDANNNVNANDANAGSLLPPRQLPLFRHTPPWLLLLPSLPVTGVAASPAFCKGAVRQHKSRVGSQSSQGNSSSSSSSSSGGRGPPPRLPPGRRRRGGGGVAQARRRVSSPSRAQSRTDHLAEAIVTHFSSMICRLGGSGGGTGQCDPHQPKSGEGQGGTYINRGGSNRGGAGSQGRCRRRCRRSCKAHGRCGRRCAGSPRRAPRSHGASDGGRHATTKRRRPKRAKATRRLSDGGG